MTSTNFVFLLAVVTLASFLSFWIWQLRKVKKEKRRGDAERLTREAKEM
jgi:hypothetical protein